MLQVAPRQISIRFQHQRGNSGRQRCRRGRSRVRGRARVVQIRRNDLLLVGVPTAVRRG